MSQIGDIRNRVKELRFVKAGTLLADPRNWRRHPDAQRRALTGVLAEIGYADALLARETPQGLVLIDGHLRAETTPDMEVPVLIIDADEKDSARILATLDPLAAMAETDVAALDALIRQSAFADETVLAMLTASPAVAPLAADEPAPTVLGAADIVDKSDRAGSSPWSRVEASDTVKCLVGDVEFGISREAALAFADICKDGGDSFRQAARDWMENALLHP